MLTRANTFRVEHLLVNPASAVSLNLWISRTISQVKIPDLKLCDLTDAIKAGLAKVDLSALINSDSALSAKGLSFTVEYSDKVRQSR